MTDKITVDVNHLRVVLEGMPDDLQGESTQAIRAALAEYDKAEQERLGTLVMVHRDDTDAIAQYSTPYRWATTFRYPWYEAAPETVEALGEFYPHQIDHGFTPYPFDDDGATCSLCTSPEWAHTPPAVPDWQTDPNVLVVEDGHDDYWARGKLRTQYWYLVGGDTDERWDTLLAVYGPIRPVGYRRDPDSIVLPGVLRERSAEWWREQGQAGDYDMRPRYLNMACRLIADALETDQ